MKEENETTIGEFVKGKRKLEKDIGALLLEFEERYGVEARSVSVFRVQDMSSRGKYVVDVRSGL